VADSLDWLQDSGDPNETYQPAIEAAAATTTADVVAGKAPNPEDVVLETTPVESENEPKDLDEHVGGDVLSQEDSNVESVDQLPSIFDSHPDESNEHLPKEQEHDLATDGTVDLGETGSHVAIEEPLFDNPGEEHDFVSTILENESTLGTDSTDNLPVLAG